MVNDCSLNIIHQQYRASHSPFTTYHSPLMFRLSFTIHHLPFTINVPPLIHHLPFTINHLQYATNEKQDPLLPPLHPRLHP